MIAMHPMPRIRGNTTPDENWKLRGDMFMGRPVYIEARPNLKRRPVVIDGKVQWHRSPNGNPTKQRFELYQDPDEPVIFTEFVLEDLGNGIVQKNPHFQPTPQEIARREALGETSHLSATELAGLVRAQREELEGLRELVMSRLGEKLPELQAELDAGTELDDLDLDAVVATAEKPAAKAAPKAKAKK